jgi:hypothetical protein
MGYLHLGDGGHAGREAQRSTPVGVRGRHGGDERDGWRRGEAEERQR